MQYTSSAFIFIGVGVFNLIVSNFGFVGQTGAFIVGFALVFPVWSIKIGGSFFRLNADRYSA